MRALHSNQSALTLVELLATITIIGVLATISIMSFDTVRGSVEGARCLQNLRNLHAGFASYTADNGHWPQMPPQLTQPDDQAKFWINTMRPLGMGDKVWKCPTLNRHIANDAAEGNPYKDSRIHYVPCQFDKFQATPYRWSTQPWLIEVGAMHGRGNFMIFPDGHTEGLLDYAKTHLK